tara:strand:+ start:72 stop:428 length:357 start_codon:yes stop_codon:yes gene_type:complete
VIKNETWFEKLPGRRLLLLQSYHPLLLDSLHPSSPQLWACDMSSSSDDSRKGQTEDENVYHPGGLFQMVEEKVSWLLRPSRLKATEESYRAEAIAILKSIPKRKRKIYQPSRKVQRGQ